MRTKELLRLFYFEKFNLKKLSLNQIGNNCIILRVFHKLIFMALFN